MGAGREGRGMGGEGSGEAVVSDDVTWGDHVYRWRHRIRAVGAAISLYRAMTWRRRNGIWVCWSSLESDEERGIFMDHLSAAMFDAWRAARGKRHFIDPVTTVVVEAGLSALDNPENEP